MKREYTLQEIKEKLEWFHGKEFNKYPFINGDDRVEYNQK
jgi:gamma-glutamylcysteine synthetase